MAYVKDMIIEDSEGNKYYNGLNPTKVIKNVNDNAAITEAGYTPDALVTKQLIHDLGGLSFYEDNTGKYVVGADSVPKKLGKVPFMVTGLNFYVQRDFNDSHGGAIGSSNSLYFSFDIAEYETMSVGTVVTTQTNTYDTSNVFYKVDDGVWVKLTSNLVLDISSNSLVTIRPAPTSYGNMNSTGSGSVKISSIIFS